MIAEKLERRKSNVVKGNFIIWKNMRTREFYKYL